MRWVPCYALNVAAWQDLKYVTVRAAIDLVLIRGVELEQAKRRPSAGRNRIARVEPTCRDMQRLHPRPVQKLFYISHSALRLARRAR
jgi:hypothetical protein